MENLHQHIEALVFTSENAIDKSELTLAINKTFPENKVDETLVEQVLADLQEKFKSDIYAFELRVIGGGYQFFTKAAYHTTVATLIGMREKKRLSTAALETLAIIAYRGPVTKSDYSVEKLLEKELIEVAGRIEDAPGKPVLYKTTQTFLDYFGINSTAELPKLKDILMPQDENTLGTTPELVSDLPAGNVLAEDVLTAAEEPTDVVADDAPGAEEAGEEKE
jgi:segregation and condensation protein B